MITWKRSPTYSCATVQIQDDHESKIAQLKETTEAQLSKILVDSADKEEKFATKVGALSMGKPHLHQERLQQNPGKPTQGTFSAQQLSSLPKK